jgi:hypothetical protein
VILREQRRISNKFIQSIQRGILVWRYSPTPDMIDVIDTCIQEVLKANLIA